MIMPPIPQYPKTVSAQLDILTQRIADQRERARRETEELLQKRRDREQQDQEQEETEK